MGHLPIGAFLNEQLPQRWIGWIEVKTLLFQLGLLDRLTSHFVIFVLWGFGKNKFFVPQGQITQKKCKC